jgi:diacylglycerol kinase (ATP)
LKVKKAYIIINPASGLDYPLLSVLNRELNNAKVSWRADITKSAQDAKKFAFNSLKKNVDCVFVAGGDGTVTDVAQTLKGKELPIGIIPCGTANVIAKELGISTNPEDALKAYFQNGSFIKPVDTGTINGKPFLLNVNIGIPAQIIKDTPRQSKDALGVLAYLISGLGHIINPEDLEFQMNLDGVRVREKGIALTIANTANVGLHKVSLLPNVDMSDGLFDVILIKKTDLPSLLKIAAGIITKSRPEEVLNRWKAEKATIRINKSQSILWDDVIIPNVKKINIKVSPKRVNFIIPKQ